MKPNAMDETTQFLMRQIERCATDRYNRGWHRRMGDDQKRNRRFLLERATELPRFVDGQLLTGSYVHRKIATELLVNNALIQCPQTPVPFKPTTTTHHQPQGYVICDRFAPGSANIMLWAEHPFTQDGDSEPMAQALGICCDHAHQVVEELAYACGIESVALLDACGTNEAVFAFDFSDGPSPARFVGAFGANEKDALIEPMTLEAYINEKLPHQMFLFADEGLGHSALALGDIARLCAVLAPQAQPWSSAFDNDYLRDVLGSVNEGVVPVYCAPHTWYVPIRLNEIRIAMPQQLRYLLVSRVAEIDPENLRDLIQWWAPFASKGIDAHTTALLGWLKERGEQGLLPLIADTNYPYNTVVA